MPRDLPVWSGQRRGCMRIDLDLKRLDTFGDRVHSAMDRVTIGTMTVTRIGHPS
jgi:ubiquinone biosynthesis protein